MLDSRIFVCYAEEAQKDVQFALQLIKDLRDAGAHIVTVEDEQGRSESDADDSFVQKLDHRLSACQWVILVQTPAALRSTRVQMAINTALNLVVQHRLRGVLAMIAAPSQPEEVPPTWTTLMKFDAGQDYPRALARILLTIGLVAPANLSSSQAAPPPVLQYSSHLKQHTGFVNDKPSLLARPRWYMSGHRHLRWLLPLALALVIITAASLIPFIKSGSTDTSAGQVPVSSTPNVSATATAFAASPQGLYSRVIKRKPIVDAPLTTQDINNWQVSSYKAGSCIFSNGAYHVKALLPNRRMSCLAQGSSFSNFAFQVQMTLLGDRSGSCGLLFRADKQTVHAGRVALYTTGYYELFAPNAQGTISKQAHGRAAIDINQPNVLTVIAVGKTVYLYVDTQYVATGHDGIASPGSIGLFCRASTKPAEALFHSAKVWKL